MTTIISFIVLIGAIIVLTYLALQLLIILLDDYLIPLMEPITKFIIAPIYYGFFITLGIIISPIMLTIEGWKNKRTRYTVMPAILLLGNVIAYFTKNKIVENVMMVFMTTSIVLLLYFFWSFVNKISFHVINKYLFTAKGDQE